MSVRLVHIVVDAGDPAALARFWAAALGWEIAFEEPDEVVISPPGYTYPDPVALPLVFVPVPERKQVKNRVHLDLPSSSPEHQQAEVGRLLALGAARADIGQHDVPWEVLADPEGNEFCVLSPHPAITSTGAVASVAMDCADPGAVAGFWQQATGWKIWRATDDYVALRAPGDAGPFLDLLKVPDAKIVKNRLHLDVAPQQGEDTRTTADELIAAGATELDLGQGQVSWVVLADPEGSEFCVLSPR